MTDPEQMEFEERAEEGDEVEPDEREPAPDVQPGLDDPPKGTDNTESESEEAGAPDAALPPSPPSPPPTP
jgi:hypothetical protein